ncbi:sirohydrochlorin cobaltochelatase [Clostridium ganghwense]|uniref:Sirohydrochlorin cobaltochelatase n=1 Tax=Clostridium ganghwense TaxID=312089 RepID=A0ABT4CRL9_9CLOT|nr:sirohydrochlorin cobaltochelatase [Clostridium ganghwense]MCY6370726.1 sirohydrochlorin cobaltochelatase [Clostridium ganghwense]
MKKGILIVMSILMSVVLFAACGNKVQTSKSEDSKATSAANNNKKAILVVSFGTSYADTRKVTLDAVEKNIAETFKDYEVKKAYTSSIIRKKLKERDGISVDSPEEALNKLKQEGFGEVIVQPLHIIPGIEYDEIKEMVEKFEKDKAFGKLVLGRPILYRTSDYKAAIDGLKGQLPKMNQQQAVVLMGHGTSHPANSSYALFDYMLKEEGLKNVYVGTVEGTPELDNVIRRLKEDNIKEVTLMPFMVVAGDHANNDMAGDEDDSWKILLKKEGFKVNTYLHGLGENKKIQSIYVQHVKDCIDGNPLMEEKE